MTGTNSRSSKREEVEGGGGLYWKQAAAKTVDDARSRTSRKNAQSAERRLNKIKQKRVSECSSGQPFFFCFLFCWFCFVFQTIKYQDTVDYLADDRRQFKETIMRVLHSVSYMPKKKIKKNRKQSEIQKYTKHKRVWSSFGHATSRNTIITF